MPVQPKWLDVIPTSLVRAVKEAAPGSEMRHRHWWLLAVTFVGVSSMMGSVNYMTTIINMRAPGMTLFPHAIDHLEPCSSRLFSRHSLSPCSQQPALCCCSSALLGIHGFFVPELD